MVNVSDWTMTDRHRKGVSIETVSRQYCFKSSLSSK